VLNATIGFTIGAASMKVTPHETGNPLLIKRRTTGTMLHSHTGKHIPSKPLTNVAKTPFLGKRPVMILDGTNTAIPPEIKDPSRTNGNPSNASARNENKKFCQVNVSQLIKACSDPVALTPTRPNRSHLPRQIANIFRAELKHDRFVSNALLKLRH
jgi:hypothetical protein